MLLVEKSLFGGDYFLMKTGNRHSAQPLSLQYFVLE